MPQAAPAKALPPKNSPAGKWIDVNLSNQRLTAYEGDNAVYSTLISTGLARYPTVVGTFKIYVNPLVNWLWLGSLLFLVGILIAAWPDRDPEYATVRASQPAQAQTSAAD